MVGSFENQRHLGLSFKPPWFEFLTSTIWILYMVPFVQSWTSWVVDTSNVPPSHISSQIRIRSLSLGGGQEHIKFSKLSYKSFPMKSSLKICPFQRAMGVFDQSHHLSEAHLTFIIYQSFIIICRKADSAALHWIVCY